MRTVLSTASVRQKDAFRLWREAICEGLWPVEITQIGHRPFEGAIESAQVGSLLLSRISAGETQSTLTAEGLRRSGWDATVTVVIMLAGTFAIRRDDREAVLRPGDIAVIDRRIASTQTSYDCKSICLEVPVARLEAMLGPARLFALVNIGSDQGGASLVRTFFSELASIHERLDPETATRMSSIGVDLLIASLAERMARDVPASVHGNLVVQRAKAHIETNLHDPTLDPPFLAAAVGVSLRRLQELFHERGQSVSDWIWGRRLQVAAARLADLSHGRLSVGMLAYGCGFSSQAHFSRRFKDRFGVTPSEYRSAAGLEAASARQR